MLFPLLIFPTLTMALVGTTLSLLVLLRLLGIGRARYGGHRLHVYYFNATAKSCHQNSSSDIYLYVLL